MKIVSNAAAVTAMATVATALAGLTAASPAAASASAAVPSAPATSSVSWHTCAEPDLHDAGLQCGELTVPMNHDKPGRGTVTLALTRLQHTGDAEDYQGIMLVNPGGPGGSGRSLAVLGDDVPDEVGRSYDWIGFDPRGVGASTPSLSCDPTYSGYNRPPYVPTSRSIEKAWFAKNRAYTDDCRQNNGAILNHLTTEDSARDMDLIRAALGESQINYYGFSYGTYLGQVYSTLFPNRVRRMVFDGTVDPRGVWYQGNLGQDIPFDRNVNIWFGWLAEHDDTYHLGTSAKAVKDLFYATQKKLYASPVKGRGGKLGGSEWNDSFLFAGYYQSTWTWLAETFSAFINDRDVDAFESLYLSVSGYGDDNGYAVYLGVQCTDAAWPQAWPRWKLDNWAIHAVAPFETWANAWYNESCRHWPAPAQRPIDVDGRKTASVLMINETLDAATPYAGSIEVRKRFPGARLIAVQGGTTHSGSLSGNACTDDRIAAYLRDGSLPRRVWGNRADVQCAPLPRPEPEASTARSAATAGAGMSATLRQDLVQAQSQALR